ncbi:MAG: hypothetical protein Q9209_005640 [Squamulea sp. 1 TL-2023]
MKVLAEGDRFIPDLLRQTYQGWVKGQIIDVLAAVVDRISYPTSKVKNALTVAVSTGEVNYSGKGISVLMTDSESAAPDLWSQGGNVKEEATSTVRSRSTLSFHFGANRELVDPPGENVTAKSFQSKTVKLPVANTIFHNGRETSIQAQRWVVGETILEPTLACINRSWLHEQVLRVAFPHPPEPDKFPLQVAVPLSRINPYQRVATSMGNVIRQLYSLKDTAKAGELNFESEAEPASKQLESAVASWISKIGNKTQAVEVWALIRPPTVLQKFCKSSFSKVIKAGGHFHKVLGGGGGWGNRQGLLALDPEVDFDVTPELTMAHDFDDEGPEVEGSSDSAQIVNPGDIVEFFARKPIKSSTTIHSAATGSIRLKCPPSFVFGTTPSTIDAVPETNGTAPQGFSPSHCVFVPRHFGMLSEQGVSLTTVSIDGEVSRTKIDVPHAVISCGTQGSVLQSFPLLHEPSAKTKRSRKAGLLRANLQNPGLTQRRIVLDSSYADTAAPEPNSEYLHNKKPTSEAANQNNGLTLSEAVQPAHIRKVAVSAKPKRLIIPRTNQSEDPALKMFGVAEYPLSFR